MAILNAAQPRLTVEYGSFSINENAGCIVSSEYDCRESSTNGSFYVEFHCRYNQSANETNIDADRAFSALIAEVEEKLRIPRQRLLVSLESVRVKDWNSNPSGIDEQTAILIEPELVLLEENSRDYRYGFRVTCQFPGNVPSNNYRRESLTQHGESLRQRRTVTITGTWTSSALTTALEQYEAQGDTFFEAQLPTNLSGGTWVKASDEPSFNDENSVLTATRVYWEVFSGRRDSTVTTVSRVDQRRVVVIPSFWVASGNSTALQNYQANAETYFESELPANVSGGQWVLFDEEFGHNDADESLVATATYHEVVNGLRELDVVVSADAANLRTLVVSGVYYSTAGGSAAQNYASNIDAVVSAALQAQDPAITRYESHSIPKVTGYDETGLRYIFKLTFRELAYKQASSDDDDIVTFSTLDVRVLKTYDPQAVSASFTPTRLSLVRATFVGVLDYQITQDPANIWEAVLRDHTIAACTSKLGSDVSAVEVVEEDVEVGLHSNTVSGTIHMIVTGGTILSFQVIQELTLVPGRRFVNRGDGSGTSAYPYRRAPKKLLYREAVVEYAAGTTIDDPFTDGTISGYGMVDTGKSAQASYDEQSTDATIDAGGWFIDPDASKPYSVSVRPTTRGETSSFNTVVHRQIENWVYHESVEPGQDLEG